MGSLGFERRENGGKRRSVKKSGEKGEMLEFSGEPPTSMGVTATADYRYNTGSIR